MGKEQRSNSLEIEKKKENKINCKMCCSQFTKCEVYSSDRQQESYTPTHTHARLPGQTVQVKQYKQRNKLKYINYMTFICLKYAVARKSERQRKTRSGRRRKKGKRSLQKDIFNCVYQYVQHICYPAYKYININKQFVYT